MKFMKRWTTTLAASFDHLIGQVENHEALVSGAIREMQEFGVKARVKLAQVERDGENMRKRLKELAELEVLWKERAVRTEKEDQARAIECLRRKKQAEQERTSLSEQLKEHQKLEEQLRKDLSTIQQRIAELSRKKNAFSARETRAKAIQGGTTDDFGLVRDLDEMFNRWELRLGEYEGLNTFSDSLEREFTDKEEEEELKEELKQIINE